MTGKTVWLLYAGYEFEGADVIGVYESQAEARQMRTRVEKADEERIGGYDYFNVVMYTTGETLYNFDTPRYPQE